ncbi:SPOC domain-containing protein 1-like [Choloepus didactylus]|uniref:SPOC domain-containing protein 1-like n=1 Tax=Choloepus didactylus TaxID=27675 RepID=UPI00189FE84F|nr:SPOC domain-containing protein 1-like [Choloepus didactylus]
MMVDLPEPSPGAQIWTRSKKRVLREEAHQGTSSQAEGAAGASQGAQGSGTEAHLGVLELPAVSQSQDAIPDPRLHLRVSSKRLQISLQDILAESWSRNLCSVSVSLPERALVGRERPAGVDEAGGPRPREAREEGMSSLGCDGRSPTLSKGEPPEKGLLSSPDSATAEPRKKSRMCGALSEGGEGIGGQSPGGDSPQSVGGPPEDANMESLGGPHSPLSPTCSGPGDPSGSWVTSALPTVGNGAWPGSPRGPVRLLLPSAGESVCLAPRDPPQSPAPCWGVCGEASAEQPEAENTLGAGSDRGLARSHSQEELGVEAQPVSRGRWGPGPPAASDTQASSLEPLASLSCPPEPVASKARSGPFRGISKWTKKLRRGPAPDAQARGTDRSSGNSSQDRSEESSSGDCPKLVS